MRRALMVCVLLASSCGEPACPPEVCLGICAELPAPAEAPPLDARVLTPAEHALLGERLLDVRHGLRAPTPQGMLEACAETPCPAGSSRPLERKIPVGTTFVSLHVMVPKEGSWPILYTRTCSPGGDMALPVWAAPVERRMELRGDVGGAASVNLVDRFDVPAGARMLSCTLKVIDPSSDGLLFVREVLVPG